MAWPFWQRIAMAAVRSSDRGNRDSTLWRHEFGECREGEPVLTIGDAGPQLAP